MQTFLPYKSFTKSLEVLDSKRLGKQRVEAMQILKALNIPEYGWKNHPCVKMWKGYDDALRDYMNKAILLWIDKGFNNTMQLQPVKPNHIRPVWLGDTKLHTSHQSNLLKKDSEFYSKYDWNVSDDIPYYWCGFGKGETNE
tara:strand:+ start:126 stop:548 length:423 start_codon:yes stop_codon:yes gene_type:complete